MSICHIICLGLVVSMCHPKWLGPSDVWTRAAAWSAGYRVLRSAWKFYTAYRTPLSNSVPRNQSSEQRLRFGIGTRGYMLATCYRIPFICCCFAKRNQKHTIGKSISSGSSFGLELEVRCLRFSIGFPPMLRLCREKNRCIPLEIE